MASSDWVPKRALHFDPRYAYLCILEDGIRVQFNKEIYQRNRGIVKVPSLRRMFSLDEYGSWEEAVVEAKTFRNQYCGSVLGDQFMRYGSVGRRLSAANSSGHVGVSEREYGVFVAYWQEHIDASKFDVSPALSILPRVQRSKTFTAESHTDAARNRAFKAACRHTDAKKAIFYPNIEALREFVLGDTQARHDDYVGLHKLLNGGYDE